MGKAGKPAQMEETGKTGRTGPNKTGSGRTGPGRTGPGKTGPGKTGPNKTGPGKTGPGKTGPKRTGRLSARTDRDNRGAGSGGTGPKGRKGAKGRALALTRADTSVPAVIEVHPVAEKARMKKRHWGLLASFILMVFLPFAGVAFYLWTLAEDQYSSVAGFTVRQEESGGSTELLGPVLSISGGSTATDGDILYEFIQSQEMVQAIDARIDLRAAYSTVWPEDWRWDLGLAIPPASGWTWPWNWDWAGLTDGRWFSHLDGDWAFGLWPDASLEDLVWYWGRVVGVSYDGSTGLIEVQVKAFDPDTAQAIGQGIVAESQQMINELSAQARDDATRYAEDELEEAVARLKTAREALTRFRTRTRIVDPAADLQGRMGVMNNLQQKLADALVEYDLLRRGGRGLPVADRGIRTPDGGPRIRRRGLSRRPRRARFRQGRCRAAEPLSRHLHPALAAPDGGIPPPLADHRAGGADPGAALVDHGADLLQHPRPGLRRMAAGAVRLPVAGGSAPAARSGRPPRRYLEREEGTGRPRLLLFQNTPAGGGPRHGARARCETGERAA